MGVFDSIRTPEELAIAVGREVLIAQYALLKKELTRSIELEALSLREYLQAKATREAVLEEIVRMLPEVAKLDEEINFMTDFGPRTQQAVQELQDLPNGNAAKEFPRETPKNESQKETTKERKVGVSYVQAPQE